MILETAAIAIGSVIATKALEKTTLPIPLPLR